MFLIEKKHTLEHQKKKRHVVFTPLDSTLLAGQKDRHFFRFIIFTLVPRGIVGEFFGPNQKMDPSHRIPVWYIYLHDWLMFMVNVGKYTSPMDSMDMFHWLVVEPPIWKVC